MSKKTSPASIHLPKNVEVYESTSLDHTLDGLYWIEVIQQLQLQMGNDFHQIPFIFYTLPTKKRPDVSAISCPNTVLIVLSDNSGLHYEYEFSGFLCVFKVHLNSSSGKVHPIPLGYTKMHLKGSTTSINDRNTSVFFSGNLNSNRIDMYRSLLLPFIPPCKNIINKKARKLISHLVKKLKLPLNFDKSFPDSYVRFTEGFAKGLDAESYTKLLADSKIAISPRGYWRPECFRHFEAMRSGCIIISDPLPDTWYFKDSPIIQLDNWADLRKTVKSLLNNPHELSTIQNAVIDWWENKCSPQSVANYINKMIKIFI